MLPQNQKRFPANHFLFFIFLLFLRAVTPTIKKKTKSAFSTGHGGLLIREPTAIMEDAAHRIMLEKKWDVAFQHLMAPVCVRVFCVCVCC